MVVTGLTLQPAMALLLISMRTPHLFEAALIYKVSAFTISFTNDFKALKIPCVLLEVSGKICFRAKVGSAHFPE
jgi:hypothetical protein